jgi:signal transduction histidine kinase
MTPPWAWSAQQLPEFLAAVSSFQTEASAALGAVERAAEALDAEVAAIVVDREVIACVGYPAGCPPLDDLQAVARGVSHQLAVPGAGMCPAAAVALDHPPGATFILARSGSEGLSREDISLLHGMARVTSLTMSMLRLLDQERSLREQSERQAAEVARLLAILTERQTKVEWLANEQAALRRVATLVADGVPHEQVFAAVAEEISRLASANVVQMFRYEADGSAVRVAVWGDHSKELQIGARYAPGGYNLGTMVLRSGRSGRIDDATTISGSVSSIARQLDIRSAVGSPIVVDGRLWGVVAASTTRPEPMVADAEQRIAGFTELVATAISNAQARTDLAASRLRVVAAADEMRRQIERNLHDGTQQRLVTLTLRLRAVLDNMPGELAELRAQLRPIEKGMGSLLDELREISRGLHPAILAQAGLGPALRSLARRAALPVTLDIAVGERLPESVEVAAYYVVSEGLANAAKHASASAAQVELKVGQAALRVHIRDDGVGGADPAQGSGILGLRDRVEALGGTMVVASPPGEGTAVLVELPIERS